MVNELTHQDKLEGVIFILTNNCNSRCIMCDYWKMGKKKYLSPDSIICFWNKQVKIKPNFVTLSGGEPLLYPYLFNLTNFFKSKVKNLVISTNGFLLENYIDEIANSFDKVIISVDGSRAETIQSIRGFNILERILKSTTKLLELSNEIKVIFKMTIQKKNFRELPTFIELAQKLNLSGIALAVPDLYTQSFIHNNDNINIKKDIMLSKDESIEFESIAIKTNNEFKKLLKSGFLVEGNLIKFVDYFKYHSKLIPKLPPRHCDIATRRLIVNFDGKIKPCFFLPSIGDIYESRQDDFFTSEASTIFIKKFKKSKNIVCDNCYQFLNWRF